MTPDQWLKTNIGLEFFQAQGFDTLQDIISSHELGLYQNQIIKIAGTNGKGTCSRACHKILIEADRNSALFTSPHWLSVCERFVFNGVEIFPNELLKLFKAVHFKVSKDKLSYYEFLFISFLFWIKEKNVEFLVMEIGLGGRLDAVNVLPSTYNLVTSISRDHTAILGETYREILQEKIAICAQGSRLWTSFELRYLEGITSEWCTEQDVIYEGNIQDGDFAQRNREVVSLLMSRILNNKITYPESSLFFNIENFSFISTHNLDSMRKCVQLLDKNFYNYEDKEIHVAFSKRELKECQMMIKILLKVYNNKIVLINFDGDKSFHFSHDDFNKEKIEIRQYSEKLYHNKAKHYYIFGSNYYFQNALGHINGAEPFHKFSLQFK